MHGGIFLSGIKDRVFQGKGETFDPVTFLN